MRFESIVHWCTSNGGWFTLLYLVDWLLCGAVLIINVSICEYLWSPTERYLPENYQPLQFPNEEEVLPTWLVVLLTMVLPVAIFLVFQIVLRSAHDFHNACLGLFETLVFNQLFTNSMQYLGGKYSPDWYARTRTGTSSMLKEGRLSYPSWHSSTTFASLGYFALYLAGKLGLFRRNSGHSWKAIIVLVPLYGASLVALTRTLDYHNDFDDITAGALLGLLMAKFFYSCNFHDLSSDHSHLPLSRNSPSSRSSRSETRLPLRINEDDKDDGNF